MRPLRLFRSPFRFALLLAGAGLLASLYGFPPNPHYTIYGIVRDELGNTLQIAGSEVALLRDGVEIDRVPVSIGIHPDHNYELRIRIDQARPGTRSYSVSALPPDGLYALAVHVRGQVLLPIEASGGNLQAGKGGERVRLDLNLGVDTIGDGIPDAWKEWQLYMAGHYPGSPGWDLGNVTRDGDYDGDGISNYHEYIAGTFAGDATDRFDLKLLALADGVATLEFFGITGKVYRIEASSDLVSWSEVPFALSPGGDTRMHHRAPDVGIVRAYVEAPDAAPRSFYRLTVR